MTGVARVSDWDDGGHPAATILWCPSRPGALRAWPGQILTDLSGQPVTDAFGCGTWLRRPATGGPDRRSGPRPKASGNQSGQSLLHLWRRRGDQKDVVVPFDHAPQRSGKNQSEPLLPRTVAPTHHRDHGIRRSPTDGVNPGLPTGGASRARPSQPSASRMASSASHRVYHSATSPCSASRSSRRRWGASGSAPSA